MVWVWNNVETTSKQFERGLILQDKDLHDFMEIKIRNEPVNCTKCGENMR